MRCVVRAALPAAILLVTGCNLYDNPYVQVARITSAWAPDTVRVHTEFEYDVTILLPTSEYVLYRFEASCTDAQLIVQAWSQKAGNGRTVGNTAVQQILRAKASATEPGKLRIIALQPGGKDTLRTITVLP